MTAPIPIPAETAIYVYLQFGTEWIYAKSFTDMSELEGFLSRHDRPYRLFSVKELI